MLVASSVMAPGHSRGNVVVRYDGADHVCSAALYVEIAMENCTFFPLWCREPYKKKSDIRTCKNGLYTGT